MSFVPQPTADDSSISNLMYKFKTSKTDRRQTTASKKNFQMINSVYHKGSGVKLFMDLCRH